MANVLTIRNEELGIRNDDAILLTSFGSADDNIRAKTFDRLAAELKKFFPTFEVRQAFTSNFMIKKLARRKIFINTPAEEIARLKDDGFRKIFLLPTHLTPGEEFDNKIKICAARDVEIIPPLISVDCSTAFDKKIFATVLDCFKPAADEDLILIGHGSPHRHNPVYENFQRLADDFKRGEQVAAIDTLNRANCSPAFKAGGSPHRHNPVYENFQRLTGDNVHIGVIESTDTPNFTDVAKRLELRRADKILLAPLLFNGGVHVAEDIAGEGDSWLNRLTALGYDCRVVRDGLGTFEKFRALYIDRLREKL